MSNTAAKWKLKRTRQCAKCPWRVDVDPHEIPDGYSEERHAALADTIATEGDVASIFSGRLKIMACHETDDAHCVGWLANQAGPGNNIALRISLMGCENFQGIKLVGEQHERFEDTLPGEDVNGAHPTRGTRSAPAGAPKQP